MSKTEILQKIKTYIADVTLDGRDIGLEPETPLLEWGVINSLEIVKLVTFFRESFGVEVPTSMVTPEHFMNLNTLSDMVVGLAASRA